MSQTAIPLQFEKYLQNQISVGKAPDMNEMIFAYIPNLDPSQPIDRNQGLPAVSTWVHQQNIDQVGKLGDNALVYSVVIPGSVAAFTFNAIYLRDKNVPNSCGMVVHKATETKEAGMASTKSLMQQYTGAAQVAGITVDAQTWQIDYQARLLGIEEDMRLASLDNYGHTAFIQGFDVTQQADPAKYKVAPGVVYVGGLRAELKNEVIQTISAKPTGLYIDVVRTGTVLSKWQNIVTVRASATPLTDYVDQNQQQHYVARLAGINANGSITDWRVKTDNADQEWSPFINYGIGQEVVRNNLRYIARAASGPDNGGVIDPSADSDWSHWKPIWALNQVENRLKGNQNWNVPGRTGHPLPDATPRNYPSGAEIVLGVFVGQGSTLVGVTLVGGVLSAAGGNYTITRQRFGTSFFAGVKLANGTIVRANPSLSETGVMLSYPSASELRITVSIDLLTSKIGVNRGAHKFAGISELPGVWADVSDEESANAVLYNKEYASVPIGVPFPHVGELPPMNDPRFRYVVLTDADPYNNGILINKEVAGAAPNLVIKYKVSMQGSPLNDTKIEMLNTMEASLNPSETKSKVFNDTIRNIQAGFSVVDSNNQVGALENGSGAISLSTTTGKIPSWLSGSQVGTRYTNATFNASNVVPTGDRNQTFAIGAKYIMRIK
ncbi:phage tail protein [Vibrio sp. R-1]|uniref:phage tail-collar fiber domain-containing protein n=1 Tax=Vibrio sp. R-1 TaxID=2682542 RepID=UPI002270FD70|nr:phage tail protein [Vibrio sp. R-1]